VACIEGIIDRHVQQQVDWDADTDYEALAVQRNAPRWIKKLIQYGYITP